MFQSVYIYGLGMMGGSLSKAIKIKNISKKIYAYDIDRSSLLYAKKNNIIDGYDSSNFEYLSNADLIIICTPVSRYKIVFKNIKKHMKTNAIITDIGSTKINIIKDFEKIFSVRSECFIGSHPLTGKESSSVKNSDQHIFKKSVVLLTPRDSDDPVQIKKISGMWKKLGCQIILITPSKHDLVLSETSHLPHLVSFALVNIILNTSSVNNTEDFTGGGFRDFARLAHSDPLMWKDICFSNEKNIIKSINLLKKELDLIKSYISSKDHKLSRYLKNIKMKLDKNDK